MAHYQGRTPNVSQYIAGLNAIPNMTQQQQHRQDFANFDDDIALFTQGDFFDFDLNAPGSAFHNGSPIVSRSPGYYPGVAHFPNGGPLSAPNSLPSSPPNGLPMSGQPQQSQPTVPSMQHFSGLVTAQQQQLQAGQKRKASSISSPVDFDDGTRYFVEEDKRRRNTAASARFRVKKKQREQALEKTAKEMTDRVSILEARISQLEMENKWLKGLITERSVKPESPVDDSEDTAVASKAARVTRKAAQDAKSADDVQVETSLPFKKRGVGTEGEAAKA